MVQNNGAGRDRVVAKALVERPVRLLEFGSRIAATRQGTVVGIFGAVLKDGGKDLIRLCPFFKVTGLNVSRSCLLGVAWESQLTHRRGSTRGDSGHRLE